MRHAIRALLATLFAVSLFGGCGGNSIDEGIPQDVDFSKNYAPPLKAEMKAPTSTAELQKKAKASKAEKSK